MLNFPGCDIGLGWVYDRSRVLALERIVSGICEISSFPLLSMGVESFSCYLGKPFFWGCF